MSADMSKATTRGPHWDSADRALRKLAIFNSLPEHSQNAYRLTVSEAIEAVASEQAELLAALRDVLDNGLIYWEPNTSRGAVNKALMIKRCRAALAKAEERR